MIIRIYRDQSSRNTRKNNWDRLVMIIPQSVSSEKPGRGVLCRQPQARGSLQSSFALPLPISSGLIRTTDVHGRNFPCFTPTTYNGSDLLLHPEPQLLYLEERKRRNTYLLAKHRVSPLSDVSLQTNGEGKSRMIITV
jgi:hypothetical protein